MDQETEQEEQTTLPLSAVKRGKHWYYSRQDARGKTRRFVAKTVEGKRIFTEQIPLSSIFPHRKAEVMRPKLAHWQREILTEGKLLNVRRGVRTSLQKSAVRYIAMWTLLQLYSKLLEHNITIKTHVADLSVEITHNHQGEPTSFIRGVPKGSYKKIAYARQKELVIHMGGKTPIALTHYHKSQKR